MATSGSFDDLTDKPVYTKTDVGLGSVPNVDATSRANHTGMQEINTVSGLEGVLEGKAEAGHNHEDTYAPIAAPGLLSRYVAVDNKTSAYTIVAADEGKLVTITSDTSVTINLPESFPVGGYLDIAQTGAGSVALTGVELVGSGTPISRQTGSIITCIKLESGWLYAGDIVQS